jgi:hypothetical protein
MIQMYGWLLLMSRLSGLMATDGADAPRPAG